MRSTLLSHRINQLLLDANRAFPSQARDAKEMINEWRLTQRCRLVVPSSASAASVPADRVHHGRDDEMGDEE